MCIFCKIINKESPSTVILEDKNFICIKNIYPQSPIHVLIIPKIHLESIASLEDSHENLMWKMLLFARDVWKELNLSWYRLQFNVWADWWQEIAHIHLHLLANKVKI